MSGETATTHTETGLLGTRSRLVRGRGVVGSWGPALIIGAVGVGLLILIAILAPLVAPHSPTAQDPLQALKSPSWSHPFGTDQLGRDVASRVVYATRTDLLVAFVVVAIAMLIGTLIGVFAGYLGGVADAVTMRTADVALAFPFIILVLSVVAVRGPGIGNLIFAASLVWWVSYARLVRGEAIRVREMPYMVAAKASGFGFGRRLLRHLSPNVILQPLVYASSDVIYAILLISSVSFLGLGVQPPTSEWGQMVSEGQNFVTTAWWLTFFPGIAVVITGILFSLLGDSLAARIASGERND